MNITEFMSFDLEWFTTLPGILITGGVVVLLIALILFIASNKKDKNKPQEVVAPVENQVPTEVQTPIDTNIDNNVMMGAAVGMMNPIDPVNNNVIPNIDNGMNINENFGVNPVEPVVNDGPTIPVVATPTNVTYSAQPAATNVVDFSVPSVEIPEVASEETVTPVVNDIMPDVTPYVEPVVANVNEPSMNVATAYNEPAVVPVEPATPVVETPVTPVQEQPVIYGGANPASVSATPVQSRPVIYGGANPLENTTTLPRMTSHEAYSASSSNIIQPVVESQPVAGETSVVAPIESAEPVVETPIAPVVSEPIAPVVENVMPQVEVPEQTVPEVPTPSIMPMTGAEMFAKPAKDAVDEIETLEF